MDQFRQFIKDYNTSRFIVFGFNSKADRYLHGFLSNIGYDHFLDCCQYEYTPEELLKEVSKLKNCRIVLYEFSMIHTDHLDPVNFPSMPKAQVIGKLVEKLYNLGITNNLKFTILSQANISAVISDSIISITHLGGHKQVMMADLAGTMINGTVTIQKNRYRKEQSKNLEFKFLEFIREEKIRDILEKE